MPTSYTPPAGTSVPSTIGHPMGNAGSNPGDTQDDVDAREKARAAQVLAEQKQAQANAQGLTMSSGTGSAGGISGFFGQTVPIDRYTATNVSNTGLASQQQMLSGMAAQIGARQNQTMTAANAQGANIDTQQQAQMRGAQSGLIGQLQDAAAGNGPSAAQQQLKTGADRTMAANLAMAAAAGTPGAQRQAAFNNAAATQDMAGQSAVLRANEINAARSQLGQVSTDARGQDIGLATNQAQLGQQNNQFNATLAQQAGQTNLLSGVDQQNQRDQLVKSYQAAGLTLDEANRQAEIQQRQFNASLLAQQTAAEQGVASQSATSAGQAAGATAGAVATALAAAASDVRLKDDIRDATDQTQAFLDSLHAVSWDYKDTKHGEGRHIGIIAQDAETTPLGASFVFEDDEGKKLDIRKALSAVLASLATLNERVKALEK